MTNREFRDAMRECGLTLAEAAILFGVHVRTAIAWAADGGRSPRIPGCIDVVVSLLRSMDAEARERALGVALHEARQRGASRDT